MAKPGLYANIHAKRKRIAAGSKEKMRKPGTKGAPTAEAFRQSAKTAKKSTGGSVSSASSGVRRLKMSEEVNNK